MVYRALGLMSGSSLDGLDLCFTHLHESSGKWQYEIVKADCYQYSPEWVERLKHATELKAKDYLLLHVDYGHYLGQLVNRFIEENSIGYQVQLISSHGHTTFHMPVNKMTAQLGDGASIAAETGINVVSDLRAMDLALGGQGAPIVPIGEKILLGDYAYFLNLGGIANISADMGKISTALGTPTALEASTALDLTNEAPLTALGIRQTLGTKVAFDVSPANRVLNLLANELGEEYDEGGALAQSGALNESLLRELNRLEYYQSPYPKSLANDFGTDVVYPIIKRSGVTAIDGLRTMTEHVVFQIKSSIEKLNGDVSTPQQLLATGGGAFNTFLIKRLGEGLNELNIKVVIPDENLIKYKEALIMALMGVLRWREENNVMSSVTGAERDSIGGAVWIGQEA